MPFDCVREKRTENETVECVHAVQTKQKEEIKIEEATEMRVKSKKKSSSLPKNYSKKKMMFK